jgi:hypothetical protein
MNGGPILPSAIDGAVRNSAPLAVPWLGMASSPKFRGIRASGAARPGGVIDYLSTGTRPSQLPGALRPLPHGAARISVCLGDVVSLSLWLKDRWQQWRKPEAKYAYD